MILLSYYKLVCLFFVSQFYCCLTRRPHPLSLRFLQHHPPIHGFPCGRSPPAPSSTPPQSVPATGSVVPHLSGPVPSLGHRLFQCFSCSTSYTWDICCCHRNWTLATDAGRGWTGGRASCQAEVAESCNGGERGVVECSTS